jgi:hypothetical protein
VILSVDRADGYDENEKLVFLNVFKHMKNVRLFSGHVQ